MANYSVDPKVPGSHFSHKAEIDLMQ